jgi:hypothetical protein
LYTGDELTHARAERFKAGAADRLLYDSDNDRSVSTRQRPLGTPILRYERRQYNRLGSVVLLPGGAVAARGAWRVQSQEGRAAWRVSSLAASRAFGAPLRGLTGLQPIPPRA